MAVTVVVLAPSPLLTVIIEDLAGEADIHVHPGSVTDALRTGAACGALDVVHSRLGTGSARAVAAPAARIETVACDTDGGEPS